MEVPCDQFATSSNNGEDASLFNDSLEINEKLNDSLSVNGDDFPLDVSDHPVDFTVPELPRILSCDTTCHEGPPANRLEDKEETMTKIKPTISKTKVAPVFGKKKGKINAHTVQPASLGKDKNKQNGVKGNQAAAHTDSNKVSGAQAQENTEPIKDSLKESKKKQVAKLSKEEKQQLKEQKEKEKEQKEKEKGRLQKEKEMAKQEKERAKQEKEKAKQEKERAKLAAKAEREKAKEERKQKQEEKKADREKKKTEKDLKQVQKKKSSEESEKPTKSSKVHDEPTEQENQGAITTDHVPATQNNTTPPTVQVHDEDTAQSESTLAPNEHSTTYEIDYTQDCEDPEECMDTEEPAVVLTQLSEQAYTYTTEDDSETTTEPNSSAEKRKLMEDEVSMSSLKRPKKSVPPSPIWVQCDRPGCLKWRLLRNQTDACDLPAKWYCSMNEDPNYNSCSIDQETCSELEEEFIYSSYTLGSIVWAKLEGYPWWPAMVDNDPDYNCCHEMTSSLIRNPFHYHVVFFDKPVSRAWIQVINIQPLTKESKLTDFDDIPKKYRSLISECLKQAKTALSIPAKERIETYGFKKLFKGKKKDRNKRRL